MNRRSTASYLRANSMNDYDDDDDNDDDDGDDDDDDDGNSDGSDALRFSCSGVSSKKLK